MISVKSEGPSINDECGADMMWVQAMGWIDEFGKATEKYYNFDLEIITPGERLDLLSHLGGEESKAAAESYSKSDALRRTGPGQLTKRMRLLQKTRALALQNPHFEKS